FIRQSHRYDAAWLKKTMKNIERVNWIPDVVECIYRSYRREILIGKAGFLKEPSRVDVKSLLSRDLCCLWVGLEPKRLPTGFSRQEHEPPEIAAKVEQRAGFCFARQFFYYFHLKSLFSVGNLNFSVRIRPVHRWPISGDRLWFRNGI